MSGTSPDIAPIRIDNLIGDFARLAPRRAVIGAPGDKHSLIVLAKHKDHITGFAIQYRSRLIDRQVTIVEKHFERSPGPPTIPAALEDQIDVGIVPAAIPSPTRFGKRQDRTIRSRQQCRDSKAMIVFFPGREDGQPFDIGRDIYASIVSRRRRASDTDRDGQQDGYGGFVQTVTSTMHRLMKQPAPRGKSRTPRGPRTAQS